MKPILEIQNISKKFRIHHERQSYLSLRDSLSSIFKSKRSGEEEFYALDNVSFDVYAGDSVGIIGKNGAGKSTLLKILSKITPPSSGKIISRGRIASLLEVGTGFHSELSGRENIFLNGSILGMKRAEIQNKFDAIVDFSGVEKFLDTPLKHYSSGMQLRLAFAVAAFLENEIMIVDEVLAVGDAEFQKKCMCKMEDVSKAQGRTVLFVSHNIDAIETLCINSILLSNGKLIEKGITKDLICNYLSSTENIPEFKPILLSKNFRLEEFSLLQNIIITGSSLKFKIRIKKLSDTEINLTDLCLLFYNYKKQRVAIYDLRKYFKDFIYLNDEIIYNWTIERFNLIEGFYNVGLYYSLDNTRNDLFDILKLQVKNKIETIIIKQYENQHRGYVELN
jgi:homopolymeric O-antigen transport system ATP-binding protein